MASESSEDREIQAVQTALKIVEFLQENDGAKLHEIAAELDMANSSVYHHLNTLISQKYITSEEDTYYPSLEFLQIGGAVRDRKRENRISKTFVESLAKETGEQVQFIVEENGFGYHVYTATGDRATSIDTRPGKRIYLHANAAGKAILAFYPEEKVNNIIKSRGLPSRTEYTITDEEELFTELDQIREQGYAKNEEEHVEGYCGLAVPVRQDGDVLGSLALGGPVERLQNEESKRKLIQLLREIVNEFELELKF